MKTLYLSKPHYPSIKAKKKTHIQLLCNYPLGITTSMQLSFWKYGELINRLSHQKISCVIVISELKMGLLYDNLYITNIHP